jgi:hypothetical protein
VLEWISKGVKVPWQRSVLKLPTRANYIPTSFALILVKYEEDIQTGFLICNIQRSSRFWKLMFIGTDVTEYCKLEFQNTEVFVMNHCNSHLHMYNQYLCALCTLICFSGVTTWIVAMIFFCKFCKFSTRKCKIFHHIQVNSTINTFTARPLYTSFNLWAKKCLILNE